MFCEDLAANYLQARGVDILARNLRCRTGELDLVGLDHNVLVIVEVRQRAGTEFGGPLASIDRRKRRKLIRTTQYFLALHSQWQTHPIRFDVFAVEGLPQGLHQVAWIKNAFQAA